MNQRFWKYFSFLVVLLWGTSISAESLSTAFLPHVIGAVPNRPILTLTPRESVNGDAYENHKKEYEKRYDYNRLLLEGLNRTPKTNLTNMTCIEKEESVLLTKNTLKSGIVEYSAPENEAAQFFKYKANAMFRNPNRGKGTLVFQPLYSGSKNIEVSQDDEVNFSNSNSSSVFTFMVFASKDGRQDFGIKYSWEGSEDAIGKNRVRMWSRIGWCF